VDVQKINMWMVDWFEKNTIAKKKELLDFLNVSYFEKGWMDSFKFISFIVDIEEEFGVAFSNDEFQNREFSTIEGLTKIVFKRLKDKK
jgi:acyl carrier protein